ncbi:suppressor of tumorigenicity 14-like protein [Labeo rohita]|uniref:chymotrypsin n=1 Tax=Labeo rohita TaxID=84645 RepID=A0A498M5G9_LABRO|nr:suppressor of tumorigenicity 14-like protein [Labeo rohita]
MTFHTTLSVAGIILLSIGGSLCQLDVCGRSSLKTKIVGGENVKAGDWPWQVSIHATGLGHYCGGTVINKDWVLSAANCFEWFSAPHIVMYLGRLSQSGSNSYETNRTASRIIKHPNFNFSNADNDIALIQLSSSVTFSDYIRPVCLAAAGSVFAAGTESWVTGWGFLQNGDDGNPLAQISLPALGTAQHPEGTIMTMLEAIGKPMTCCSEEEMEEEDKVGKKDVPTNVLQQPRMAKTKVTIFSTLTEGEAEDLAKGFGMALAKHVPKEKVLTGIPEEDIPATL